MINSFCFSYALLDRMTLFVSSNFMGLVGTESDGISRKYIKNEEFVMYGIKASFIKKMVCLKIKKMKRKL